MARLVAEAVLGCESAARAWDIRLDAAEVGYAQLPMTIRSDTLTGHQTAHGGMIFALADTAFAYACNSRNAASVAAQASIIYLSPANEGEVLMAEAWEGATAGRSGAYTVTVTTREGRPVATFQGLARAVGGHVLSFKEDDLD